MGVQAGTLIVCIAIYLCNIIMLNKIKDAIDELRKIKRYLLDMDMVKSKEE